MPKSYVSCTPVRGEELDNSFAELKGLVSNAGRRMRYLDQHTEIGSDVKYATVLLEHIA